MRRPNLMLVIALALVAAACGGGGQVTSSDGTSPIGATLDGSRRVAATYEGGEITVDDVAAMIPSGVDTVDAVLFAATLNRLIVDRVFSAAAEQEYGVVPDEAGVADRLTSLIGQLTGDGQAELDEALVANLLTQQAIEAMARQQTIFDLVQVAIVADRLPPTDAEMREVYDSQIPAIAEVCSRHILLESEDEAVVVLDRALAGEDFADLAVELSTGPSGPAGGDLGCAAPAGFVPAFAEATLSAEVGVPIGPVETQFGWHVILVESRNVPTYEESKQAIEEGFADADGSALFNEWIIAKLAEANVQVDEQYGTWTLDPNPAVLPPAS